MSRNIALACVLALALVIGGAAQASRAVVMDADLRLFTAMTALNAAGFDVELGSQYHPVRVAARNAAKDLDPALITRLKDFYQEHKRNESDDAQLAKYISLAVVLSGAPDFKLQYREEFLSPEAREVKDFADLMREVFLKARLSSVWGELRPQYEEEINRLGPSIREELVKTDAYLRVALGAPTVRTLSILVELAAPINSVNVRSDQDNYYVVLGQSTASHLEDIRHAYLHFQLDTLVALNASKAENGPALLQLVKDVSDVQPDYVSDFRKMMTESLIRAIEVRMDKRPAATAKETVDTYYREGLLLMPYFYEALQNYESQDAGIRDTFPQMVSAFRLADEQNRFGSTFMNIKPPQKAVVSAEVPQAPEAPAPNPTRDLLKQGEAALNANDNARAKAAFEKVLSDYDRNNGAAFYGLALIASKAGDTSQARDFFEKTTRTEVDPSMKVWAYIYLGRIYDIECLRERAVQYYQQAVKVGDDTRKAQSVAQEGIKKPYGDDCR